MYCTGKLVLWFVVCVGAGVCADGPTSRSTARLYLPFLGLGPTCQGCPPHYCDDDPAIIHGYCCGCAGIFERLPITCPGYLNCPLDGAGLCQDYEYMMKCCC